MTLERPTRTELVQKLQAAIESRLSFDQLRHSDAKVYARAFAGTADAIYSLCSYMHRQQFVFSCDSEYLDRHGALYGITRKAASRATGSVTFDVSAGGSIAAGAAMQSDDGVRFIASADDDNGVVAVYAEEAGTDGNLAAGASVDLITPVVGVSSSGSVTTAISGGTEAESDDAFRARILQKMRETPMGGAASDFVTWALEVPGVTRAWCYPEENGEGTVTVRFVCDDQAGTIIPTDEMVATVKAYIEERRPVCCKVTVAAPVALPVAVTFASLSPDTELVKARIEADLLAMFKAEAEPGVTLPISHIRACISDVVGETDSVLTAPAANIVPATGYIPTLGTITWP